MKHFSKVHIANTLFEVELSQKLPGGGPPFERGPSIALQLQFLPSLYAKEGEAIVVLGRPNPEFRCEAALIQPDEKFVTERFDVWGQTDSVKRFATREYQQTPLEIVKKVNARSFLRQEKEPCFPVVIKDDFGFSGRGMRLIQNAREITEVKDSQVVESWKERIRDFSSQWEIDDRGVNFIGWTELFNTSSGSYLGTRTSSAFGESRTEAEKVVISLFEEGYRGPVGIDAFWYLEEGKELCKHVVEVNARRTLSRAILDYSKEAHVQFVDIKSSKNPLLPSSVTLECGKTFRFRKQLDLML